MKKTSIFVLVLWHSIVLSQISNRIGIDGQIIVEGSDLENITIYNSTASQGTLSDVDGKFNIPVRVNDTLKIRALQYQDFDVIINTTIVSNRQLRIFLIQEINQLDEIIVRDKTFTGQLHTDIASVKTFVPKLDAVYYGIQQEPQLNESTSDFTKTDIVLTSTTSQNKPLVNGLNIISVVDQLLLPLFRAELNNSKDVAVPKVPLEAIKHYLGAEFLFTNFNIPTDKADMFIRFVERNNFDFTLLNYGHELELLELLHQKSLVFLNKNDND